jgi:hypothetical protein
MVTTATIASRENRLANWRAAIGRMLQGPTYRPRIMCIGTSKMMGSGASTDPANTYTNGAALKRKTQILARLMTANGLPAWDNAWIGNNRAPDFSTYDPRVTLGAGWNFDTTTVPFSFGENNARNSGGGAGNLAFAPTGTFDKVDTFYCTGSSTGVFTVSDGSTLLDTVDGTVSSTVAIAKKTSTLASRGSGKTINTARSSGTPYIFGQIPYDSTVPGIDVLNGGAFGRATANWVVNGIGQAKPRNWEAWAAYGVSLAFISIMANDQVAGVLHSVWKANIQILITAAKTAGADVVLVMESTGRGSYTTYTAEYRQAAIELAAENNCIFHDEDARYNYTTRPTWFSDNVHEKDFAHADGARAWLPYALPHLMA